MTRRRRRSEAGNATPTIVAIVVMAMLTIGFAAGAATVGSGADARVESIDAAADDTVAAVVAGIAAIDDAARRYASTRDLDTTAMLDALAEADTMLTELAVPDESTPGAGVEAIRAAIDAHQQLLTTLAAFSATPAAATAESARVVIVAVDDVTAALETLGDTRLRPDQTQAIVGFTADVVERALADAESSAQAAAAFADDLDAAALIESDRADLVSAATNVDSIMRELRGSWPPLDEPFFADELDQTTERHDDAAAALQARLVTIEQLDVHPAIQTAHTLVLNDITALRKQVEAARDTLITIACTAPGSTSSTSTSTSGPSSSAPTSTRPSTTTTSAPCPDLAGFESWANARGAIDSVLEELNADLDDWQASYETAVREVFR